MLTELLAPAKDKHTAFEAINCGADAVYIGAPKFGARKNVPNTLDDIKEVIDYAHKFWVKVFVTMNTILTDEELEEAVLMAKQLSNIGADGLIIQDMGLLEKLMNLDTSPQPSPQGEGASLAPIHMSTQCNNYLPQKVKFFNDIGVSRVILARELSVEQIHNIHKENPNLELETFIHGALCVSMSGQCYLSEHIGGRSANRGECAQPCRKKYTVETTDGKIIKKDFYALCLKDFNASECLEDLKNAGVFSFKIEGRLKDVGYVKNIVSYYRQRLGKGTSSGKSTYSFIPNPEKSFNRGFTEYFLRGRTDCYNQESPKSRGEYLGEVVEVGKNWFRIKANKEIHVQDGFYFKGDGFAVNKIEKNLICPNKPIKLKIGDKLWRNFDSEFEKELAKPVKRQIGVFLSIKHIESDVIKRRAKSETLVCHSGLDPESHKHEVNAINLATSCQARGDISLPLLAGEGWGEVELFLIDEDGVSISKTLPQGEKSNNPEKMKENFIKQFLKTGESDFYIENIKIDTELPFMPVSTINNLRRELLDKLMEKRIKVYNSKIRQIQKPMKYVQYFEREVDYRANVHNKSAEEFYSKCGVKVLESSYESKKPKREVKLMQCKHCIKYALNMCKSKTNLVLRDEFGKTYPLRFDCKNCEMSILSS